MPENGEENCRIEGLPPALVEMSQYLDRLEQGCTDLVDHFHSDRAALFATAPVGGHIAGWRCDARGTCFCGLFSGGSVPILC